MNDELVLRIAGEQKERYADMLEHCQLSDVLCDFARRLRAEWEKGQEPVAELISYHAAKIRWLNGTPYQSGGFKFYAAPVSKPEQQEPLIQQGYGDDDERWGETVEQYVEGCVNSHDYDDLISGEPFSLDAYFYRSEQWRTVAVNPIKCERIDAAPVAKPVAAKPICPICFKDTSIEECSYGDGEKPTGCIDKDRIAEDRYEIPRFLRSHDD